MENQKMATLESILKEDSSVVLDCLEITNFILGNLVGGNSKVQAESVAVHEPSCMMEEVIDQSNNLKALKSRLLEIKTTMLNN